MEWTDHEREVERLRAEMLRVPAWAKMEQLERIIPQKDLWTPENLVRPGSRKEDVMTKEKRPIRKYQIATFVALAFFATATFQIADGNMALGVVFFGAASCFSSLAGIYRERDMGGIKDA